MAGFFALPNRLWALQPFAAFGVAAFGGFTAFPHVLSIRDDRDFLFSGCYFGPGGEDRHRRAGKQEQGKEQ